MKMPPDGFRSFAGDNRGEGLGGGLLHFSQAAEVSEQALPCLWADAGNVQ